MAVHCAVIPEMQGIMGECTRIKAPIVNIITAKEDFSAVSHAYHDTNILGVKAEQCREEAVTSWVYRDFKPVKGAALHAVAVLQCDFGVSRDAD